MKALSLFRRHMVAAQARRPLSRPCLEILEARNLLAPTNVQVNAPDTSQQDTQSETSLVVTPNGTIVSAFNNSAVDTANNHFTGFANSTDGGNTFSDHSPLPTRSGGDAGDPILAYSAHANAVFFSTLGFTNSQVIQLYKSTDGGASFQSFGTAASARSGNQLDKDWLAVDNFPGPGFGNIYSVFTDFLATGADRGVALTRSTNDGASFSSGVRIGGSQGGYVVVGPDHTVYVFVFNGNSSPEKILMAKSTDQGQTFSSLHQVTILHSTGINGDLGLDFRTNSFPHVAVNPVTGALYVVYNNGTPTDRGNIYFRQSTDGGTTWSSPLKINDDHTNHDQWQPDIAVTPDGTHLFIGWYDRRLDHNNSLINWFGDVGTVSGSSVSFGANFQISSASFPEVFGQDPVVNSSYMGDYDQAAADNNFFYTTWGDNRNGDAFHTNQPDVFFAKIPVTGLPSDIAFGSDLVRGIRSGTTATTAFERSGRRDDQIPASSRAADLVFQGGLVTRDQAPAGKGSAPLTHQDFLGAVAENLWQSL